MSSCFRLSRCQNVECRSCLMPAEYALYDTAAPGILKYVCSDHLPAEHDEVRMKAIKAARREAARLRLVDVG